MSVPVLWLCGPPGVGKTSVGLELHRRLESAAYVDIDQLGMGYPERPDDPDRHRLKARNLDAVVRCFAAAGAACVVVSGVVHSTDGVPIDELPHADVTVVRLRAAPDVISTRFVARTGQPELVDAVLVEAGALDASTFASACVDTTTLTVDEVVDRVQEVAGEWPPSAPPEPTGWPPIEDPGGAVVVLHGPPGVGKSTIGFGLFQRLLQSGAAAAYVDADQLRFGPTATTSEVRARALAAIAVNMRAEVLVAVTRVADDAFVRHLPASTTWLRLTVDAGELEHRVLGRGRRGSWAEPGDELLGRPDGELRAIAAAATPATGPGVAVDTTGLSPAEAVERVSAAVSR